MEKNISLDQMFMDKLIRDYGHSKETAMNLKNAIFKNIPKELLINIYQWSNDKDLLDVKVYGVSILDLYERRAREDFILAIMSLSAYAADPHHHYAHLDLRSL